MSDFDDAADPELGAACNRLAAWVLPLPVGGVIDEKSGLTETDLVRILRRLYATRQNVQIEMISLEEAGKRYGRPANPMSDTELLAAYERTTGQPDNRASEDLLAEIKQRNLDI